MTNPFAYLPFVSCWCWVVWEAGNLLFDVHVSSVAELFRGWYWHNECPAVRPKRVSNTQRCEQYVGVRLTIDGMCDTAVCATGLFGSSAASLARALFKYQVGIHPRCQCRTCQPVHFFHTASSPCFAKSPSCFGGNSRWPSRLERDGKTRRASSPQN